MIDWAKPIRWTDDKKPATVWLMGPDSSAWVKAPDGRTAYLFDLDGKRPGVISIENVPEPIVTWVIVWSDGGASSYRHKDSVHEIFKENPVAAGVLKLTYTPGNGATVEVVEERK